MTDVPEREDPAVPAHDALFDDPLAPPSSSPSVPPTASPVAAVAAESPAPAPWVPAPDDEPVAVRPGPAVDTGRLFRSAGAEGPAAAAAIPAITDEQLPVVAAGGSAAGSAGGNGEPAPVVTSDETPALETPALEAASAVAAAAVVPGASGAATPEGAPVPVPGATPVPPTSPSLDVVVSPGDAPDVDASGSAAPAYRGGAGLTWTGVTVVEIGVTALLGLADVLVTKNIGIITGVALVLVSLYCALVVRPADLWAAVVTPPIAYLITLLTAGLLTYTGGGFVARTGLGVFTDLALNAPWIIAATGLSLIIVLVRRAKARKAGILPAR